jgi:hypothetical protein
MLLLLLLLLLLLFPLVTFTVMLLVQPRTTVHSCTSCCTPALRHTA